MALRLIDVSNEEGLIFPNSTIGFTGRAAISGRKPEYIVEGVAERGLFENPNDRIVFVDDGLARGAALMGRGLTFELRGDFDATAVVLERVAGP